MVTGAKENNDVARSSVTSDSSTRRVSIMDKRLAGLLLGKKEEKGPVVSRRDSVKGKFRGLFGGVGKGGGTRASTTTKLETVPETKPEPKVEPVAPKI